MQLEINNRQAGMNEDISLKATRLIRFALSRFAGPVSHVKATFSDVNGPKGGIDKRCRITAKMNTAGQLVVQSHGGEYIEALSLCLDKLTRTIRRELARRRSEPIRKLRKDMRIANSDSIYPEV